MKVSPYPCPCTLCGELIWSGEDAYRIRTKHKTDSGREHHIHRTCWEKLPKRGDREVGRK